MTLLPRRLALAIFGSFIPTPVLPGCADRAAGQSEASNLLRSVSETTVLPVITADATPAREVLNQAEANAARIGTQGRVWPLEAALAPIHVEAADFISVPSKRTPGMESFPTRGNDTDPLLAKNLLGCFLKRRIVSCERDCSRLRAWAKLQQGAPAIQMVCSVLIGQYSTVAALPPQD